MAMLQLQRRADDGNAATGEKGDSVTESIGLVEVVRGQQNRLPALQAKRELNLWGLATHFQSQDGAPNRPAGALSQGSAGNASKEDGGTGSRPVVGSSSSRTAGSPTSATASDKRRRMPPLVKRAQTSV
jgi:hypothetical protein